MYVLSLTAFCAFVVLGSAREQLYEPECCAEIRGFRECKRECTKAWTERDSGKELQLALSLPKVCPSHLINLWKCLNSSIKGLHLYSHSNLLKESKSCCLLGIDASCRKTCFLSTSSEEITKSCKREEEESLLRCIRRNDASRTCCRSDKRKCERSCQNVFASNKAPSNKTLKLVKRNCRSRKNRGVYKCVSNIRLPKVPDHVCCRMTKDKKCQAVCRKVMGSKEAKTPWKEKIMLLKQACHVPFYHDIWVCLLTHSDPMETSRPETASNKVDVRLHCCLSAKTMQCFELCLKTYFNGETDEQFKRRCEFNPSESKMLTCIADVSQPCHIGCSGLGFCTNFNHRHTELFRSCTKEKDNAAKSDYETWLKKKRVQIHSMNVIPVKDISKCLPNMWKAVACTLQIRPCHTKSHGSTICRSDCLKILGECVDKEKLGVGNVDEICTQLSPDDQSSCISLESYLKPSSYKNETNDVTHPCYPNPCPSKDVCEINRETPENGDVNFVPYQCTPGCPVDQQSKTVIKNGDFARIPIVQNSKLEGCFKICRCEQGDLSVCPRLPSCVKEKECYFKITNGTYKHQEKFFVNCNFCVCFDGEVICSMSQCLPEVGNNSTGRLRRNHLPNADNTINGLSCQCQGKYEPVCGTNGKTYRSVCLASCVGLSTKQVEQGQCSSINPCRSSPCPDDELCVVDRKVCVGSMSSCPQYFCIKRPQNCTNSTTQLLCDTENKQHSSQCETRLNGREVAYSGKCNPLCAPGKQDVCGVDGQTYTSMCALKHAHMLLDYEGACKTVGKYGNDDSTVRCAKIKCPKLNPPNCDGVTPPGACCKVCASLLTVLFDEGEISNTNKIVMGDRPITQRQVVARVRRHLSMSECDVFGFYDTSRDFILLVKAVTEKPTRLQFIICNKEAEKIQTLINTQSPIFTSDEILSSFRAVRWTTPMLSEKQPDPGKAALSYSSSSLLFICTLLALKLSWTS